MTEIAAFTPHLVEAARDLWAAAWALPLAGLVALALAPTFVGLWSGSALNALAVAALNGAAVIAWWHGGALAADALVGTVCFLAALALALILRRERRRSAKLAALAAEVGALNAQMSAYLEALHLRAEAVDERAVDATRRLEATERALARRVAVVPAE